MIENFVFRGDPTVLALFVLVVLVLAVELPYRFGGKLVRAEHVPEGAWNTVYAGLLALVAFVVGLSYAQAAGRFDERRALVVKEANAIGTTWLRADQLPAQDAARFKSLLLRYAQVRFQAYSHPGKLDLFNQEIDQSKSDLNTLWNIASPSLKQRDTDLGLSLLMQTLNDTIDVSEEQYTALTQHVPTSVVVLMFLLLVLATAATGFSFARLQARPTVFAAMYVFALAVVFLTIVDVDRPQSGFIRVSLAALSDQIHEMESSR